MAVRLSVWARENGFSYRGALRAFHAGSIPGAYQLDSGTVLVKTEPVASRPGNRAALYARVPAGKESGSLPDQMERLRAFAGGRGWTVVAAVSEVGSGMDDHRRKLTGLMSGDDWDVLVVEHQARLARFGATWIEGWASATGRVVVYVDATTVDDEASLRADFVAVVTWFCARLYGRRGAAARASAAVAAAMSSAREGNSNA